MAKGKIYYWIKLKTDFMTSDKVDFIMSQPNGAEYVVLYQMLCLKCINTDGVMARQLGEVLVPFDTAKIERDCKYFSQDTILVALSLFKKLGMIYEQENGCLIISEFSNMVGSETDYAIQKREQRKQQKELCLDNKEHMSIEKSRHDVDSYVDIVHTEKEIEIRDREKIKDKNIIVDSLEPTTQTALSTSQEVKHPVSEFDILASKEIIKSCLELFPNSKVPQTEEAIGKWAIEVERMRRLDGRSEEEIKEALYFAVHDGFWQSNIRSTKKFREKFETLILQARRGKGHGNTYGNNTKPAQESTMDFAQRIKKAGENLGL